MRIIEATIAVATLGLAIGLGSAIGFEGNRVEPAAIDCGPQTVMAGDAPKSMGTLTYAAEQGNAVAQWKLGRMYATGEGVPRCDLRAFGYFSRIANGHADDYPDAPQAPFVANAFVALGQYYLDGIPNSPVKADPNRARNSSRNQQERYKNRFHDYFPSTMSVNAASASICGFRQPGRDGSLLHPE